MFVLGMGTVIKTQGCAIVTLITLGTIARKAMASMWTSKLTGD
jgi:hypothetical protein